MIQYIIKKFITGILTLFVIVLCVFLLMRALPKEKYFTDSELNKLSQAEKQFILEKSGLLDPMGVQIKNYFKQIFKGDFGTSRKIEVGKPVLKMIKRRMSISFLYGMISFFLSLVLGVSLGIFQTIHKDKLGDKLGLVYTVIADAIPSVVLFSVILIMGAGLFHLPSLYSPKLHPLKSSIMPIICMSLSSTAGYALWTRRYMVDELNKDYITLARMKGLTSKQIMIKHVARNAFVPMVQFIPASILLTISGALLTETFFGIPGMGPLLSDAIRLYDLDVVQTLVIIYAALGIVGVILGDILMCIVDPRIVLGKDGGTR